MFEHGFSFIICRINSDPNVLRRQIFHHAPSPQPGQDRNDGGLSPTATSTPSSAGSTGARPSSRQDLMDRMSDTSIGVFSPIRGEESVPAGSFYPLDPMRVSDDSSRHVTIGTTEMIDDTFDDTFSAEPIDRTHNESRKGPGSSIVLIETETPEQRMRRQGAIRKTPKNSGKKTRSDST